MKGTTKQSQRHVEAVLAALDVLDCFLAEPSLGTKEIIERTGLTRNRVMRLGGTLLSRDYLLYDEASGKYSPGPRLMSLGKVYERHNDLLSVARPMLKMLVRKTGESASLYVRNGLGRMVLAREDGTHPLRYASVEGQTMALGTGAGGKTLLAFAPEDVRQRFLAPPEEDAGQSPNAPGGNRLAEELDRIAGQGYAISFGERVPDCAAITAPVFGYENRLAAAIGVVGPTSRIKENARPRYLSHVLEAARRLSTQLGCLPPSQGGTVGGDQ